MKAKLKIGIMGGTFDPIHNAHLALAEAAYEQLGLDYVLFIPACQPPHKDTNNVSPANIRSEMVQLAIENNPHFLFSDIEIRRVGKSYTVDTLYELHEANKNAEYYFILGADSLFSISKWYKPDEIMAQAVIAAGVRDGKTTEEMLACISELKDEYNADIRLLRFPNLDIASHELRKTKADGFSIRYLVPEKVNEYIMKNNLYSI